MFGRTLPTTSETPLVTVTPFEPQYKREVKQFLATDRELHFRTAALTNQREFRSQTSLRNSTYISFLNRNNTNQVIRNCKYEVRLHFVRKLTKGKQSSYL